MVDTPFNFSFPIELKKGSEDEWRIRGLASTASKDLQGEVVRQEGLDISALKAGLGLFNYDHEKGPENIIGVIDDADLTEEGLMVEGYLLKEQPRARAFYDIMRSLKPEHSRRVQFSIEGKIIQRSGDDGKTIKQAKVEKVALTVDPVNTDTYAEIIKSLSKTESGSKDKNEPRLTEEVIKSLKDKVGLLFKMRLLKKALSVGTGYASSPSEMSGGSVLTQESLDGNTRDLFDEETIKTIKAIAKTISEKFPHMDKIQVAKSIIGRVQDLTTV